MQGIYASARARAGVHTRVRMYKDGMKWGRAGLCGSRGRPRVSGDEGRNTSGRRPTASPSVHEGKTFGEDNPMGSHRRTRPETDENNRRGRQGGDWTGGGRTPNRAEKKCPGGVPKKIAGAGSGRRFSVQFLRPENGDPQALFSFCGPKIATVFRAQN